MAADWRQEHAIAKMQWSLELSLHHFNGHHIIVIISRIPLQWCSFDAPPNGLLASKGHHYNDVVIIIKYHYSEHIIVNISRSVQHACAKTANEHDVLILRAIQPGDVLSAISMAALNLEGKFAMFGFVYYCEECSPSALLLTVCLSGPRCPPWLHNW